MRVGILCIFLLFCLSVLLTAIAWILLHIDGSIVTSVQGANPSGDDGAISRNYDVMIENDPTILFMMASYSFEQFLSLQNVLDNLRDICNSGWNVTVHLQVSAKGLVQTHPSLAILQDRMYCIRTNHHIPILIEEYGMVGFGLNSKHRTYAAAHIDDFDYFAYAEEDMLLTISHLAAYQSATKKLMKAFPDSWMRYQVGFLRFVQLGFLNFVGLG